MDETTQDPEQQASDPSRGPLPDQNAVPTPQAAPLELRASIYPPLPLPQAVVECVNIISEELGMPCWLFFTGVLGVDPIIHDAFLNHKADIPEKPIALVIDSFGGNGETAYRLSRLLQERCNGFVAVVPRLAKSAATLLSLGADRIVLGDDADLGPLDAQFHDYDEEERQVSALDTVQAVEALEESAVEVGMKMLRYLQQNTGKRYSLLIEPSLKFAAEITKPLFDKIDAVRYTRQSRILREAQDYAERLLRRKFTEEDAKAISRDLVQNYPSHGFVIDYDEAKRVGRKDRPVPGTAVGLHVEKPNTPRLAGALSRLRRELADDRPVSAFGRLVELELPT